MNRFFGFFLNILLHKGKVVPQILPEIKLKKGVILNGPHLYPDIVRMINVARATAPKLSDNTLWITSANDSKHMDGSLHYKNRAFDIRIWNVEGGIDEVKRWVVKMQTCLNDDYDVVLEKDHIHQEFDPEINQSRGF